MARRYDDESESEGSEVSEYLGADSDIDEATVDIPDASHRDHHDDESEYSASEGSVSDGEEDEPVQRRAKSSHVRDRPNRRGEGGRAALPKRSMSTDGTTPKGRRPPPRSKSFDGDRPGLGYGREASVRSLGGARMRREGSQRQVVDKDARADARARRLRAVGQGPKNCQLLRRSQSFSNRSSGAKLNISDHSEEKKEGGPDRERKVPERSNSGFSTTDEDRQYARTAARGVTRCKSLRGEKINIDNTTKSVASKLQAMRGHSEHASTTARRNAREPRERQERKTDPESPKAVASGGMKW